MKIPGRAGCDCFYDKKLHNMKTGKFNYLNSAKQLGAPWREIAPPGCPNLPASPTCFAEDDKLNEVGLRKEGCHNLTQRDY